MEGKEKVFEEPKEITQPVKPGEVFPEAAEVSEKEPPIKEGEIFDADADLKSILKKPSGKERDKMLAVNKEKFIYQREGFAAMQQAFFEKITDNPDISAEELSMLAVDYSNRYGFPIGKRLDIFVTADRYVKKREDVVNVLKDYHVERESGYGLDKNRLFSDLFGSGPKGEIDIFLGPINILVRCHNQEDYALAIKVDSILNEAYEEEAVAAGASGSKAAKLSKTGISALDGSVVVENFEVAKNEAERLYVVPELINKHLEEDFQNTFAHEEQHTLHGLFKESKEPDIESHVLQVASVEDEDDKKIAIRLFFKEVRKFFFAFNKDEALAYMTGNFPPEEIEGKLVDLSEQFKKGGFYNLRENQGKYLIDNFISKLPANSRKTAEDEVGAVFGERYDRLVGEAIDAAVALLRLRKNASEVRAMLSSVPFYKWSAEVSRLTEQPAQQAL